MVWRRTASVLEARNGNSEAEDSSYGNFLSMARPPWRSATSDSTASQATSSAVRSGKRGERAQDLIALGVGLPLSGAERGEESLRRDAPCA